MNTVYLLVHHAEVWVAIAHLPGAFWKYVLVPLLGICRC